MFKYAAIAVAIGGAVYFVAQAMQPTQTPLQTITGGIVNLVNALKGATTSTTSAPNASASVMAPRTVSGQTPYGTKSSQDGDAAISDAMGVAGSRTSQPLPNLYLTKRQMVLGGAALGASPFVS